MSEEILRITTNYSGIKAPLVVVFASVAKWDWHAKCVRHSLYVGGDNVTLLLEPFYTATTADDTLHNVL
jgi:hypothetical protein